MQGHSDQHGDNEQDRLWDADRQGSDRRAGAEAADPPAEAEEGRPYYQRCVDPAARRDMEAVVKSGMAHSLHHLHADERDDDGAARSEEHTSELQSLMRTSYAVFCLKKKKKQLS